MAPFGSPEEETGRKGLRDAVWSVGTNLPKQVGVDWALPSCRGVGRAITSTPLHPTPELYMLARPVCQPITHTAELPVVYHVFGGCPRRFHWSAPTILSGFPAGFVARKRRDLCRWPTASRWSAYAATTPKQSLHLRSWAVRL